METKIRRHLGRLISHVPMHAPPNAVRVPLRSPRAERGRAARLPDSSRAHGASRGSSMDSWRFTSNSGILRKRRPDLRFRGSTGATRREQAHLGSSTARWLVRSRHSDAGVGSEVCPSSRGIRRSGLPVRSLSNGARSRPVRSSRPAPDLDGPLVQVQIQSRALRRIGDESGERHHPSPVRAVKRARVRPDGAS